MRTIPTAAPTAAPATTPAVTVEPATGSPSAVAAAVPATTTASTWPGHEVLHTPETARVMHAAWSGDPAVLVPSPPGAGKTRLVALLAAGLAHRAEMRVGVAAQTREQAVEIARRVGALSDRVKLIWSRKGTQPDAGLTPVVTGGAVRFPASGGGVLIATTARWLYADPRTLACDLLVVDEAWQATYADLGALGAFAGQIVCVGDPGQIDPVVTGETRRWQARENGPHLPAPAALLAAHGDAVGVIALKHTWRLGPETTALIQPAFYPSLPFTSRRPPEHVETPEGPLPELAHRAVTSTAGPSDPALTVACADRARDLLNGASVADQSGSRALTAADVAVVCPHVSQAAAVRALLADHPDVLVGTANQLQGLERTAVVALHPFAGYRDASAFTADTGRACVMLSRHRSHLTVVLDSVTPAVLGAADDDLPGLHAHRALVARLLATVAC